MAARYSYYLLADSADGTMKEAEITDTVPKEPPQKVAGDVKKGFVHKRVPHITLKSIANNEKIDTIRGAWGIQAWTDISGPECCNQTDLAGMGSAAGGG